MFISINKIHYIKTAFSFDVINDVIKRSDKEFTDLYYIPHICMQIILLLIIINSLSVVL